jgi:DNA-binding transcriptional LysR family regulator
MRTLKSPPPASDPDWDDLKVLLALSRGASVAAAARAMGVDQSTVSRRLAALEEAVGCPLLIRGGREFSWTAEGRTMVGAAEAAEAALQAATRTSRLDAAGVVRVSTTPGIAAFLLRVLPDFQRKRPGLELDLSGSMEHMDLAKGEADIALRGGEPTEPDVVAHRLIRCAWFLYASEAYLREAGRPESLDDLQRHRLVLLAPTLHPFAVGLRWLEGHRGEGTAVIRVDNIQAAAQVAALGRGIVVLPVILALAEPALVRAWREPVVFTDLYVAYHASLRGVAHIQAAVEVLAETMAAHAPVLSGQADQP